MSENAIAITLKTVLPGSFVRWVQTKRFRTARPPVGWVRFGSLRRIAPVSRFWGHDRGRPINRHYIEGFLALHEADVRGRVLEVADNQYTVRFGGARVTRSDILHATPDNPQATIVADLAQADPIPDDTFDCVILTQVMQYINDGPAAAGHLRRILKPGGVLLATLPGLEKISRTDNDKWGDYWRFTRKSAETLFAGSFGKDAVEVRSYGNVFAACASLMGLAQEDVRPEELDVADEDFPVIVAVRAVKQAATGAGRNG